MAGSRGDRETSVGVPVPTGLQRLLRLASAEPAFLDTLIERREAAAEAAGVALRPGERSVLRSVPAETLARMARTMPPPPSDRLPFLRRTAATAVVLLGGAVLSEAGAGCRRDTAATGADTVVTQVADRDAAEPVDEGVPQEIGADDFADAGDSAFEQAEVVEAAADPDLADSGTEIAAEAFGAADGWEDAPVEVLTRRPAELRVGSIVTTDPYDSTGPSRPFDRGMDSGGGAAPDMPPDLPVGVSHPPIVVRPVAVQGGLTRESFMSALRTARSRIERCAVLPIQRGGEWHAGVIELRIETSPAGRVTDVALRSDSTGVGGVAACMVSGLRAVRFPTANEPTEAVVQFDLRPADPG